MCTAAQLITSDCILKGKVTHVRKLKSYKTLVPVTETLTLDPSRPTVHTVIQNEEVVKSKLLGLTRPYPRYSAPTTLVVGPEW